MSKIIKTNFAIAKSGLPYDENYVSVLAKGKSKKLALIAVCNKLLKQAFAIAKSGLFYDDSYRSTLVKN
mgnify:FL=1